MARARRIRTVGAVVVNPRRKHRKSRKTHRKARAHRRNPSRKHRKARKSRRKAHRRTKARRNPRRGRVRVKAHSRRRGRRKARRNPYVLGSRRNPRKGRKGKKAHRRGHRRGRRHARRNPGYGRRTRATAVTNPRHRRRRYARRNPGLSGISSSVSRIPLVGPLLASMIGLAPAAAVGAVSLEPTFQLAKWSYGQTWVPQYLKDSELAFFSLSGLAIGSVFAWLAPKTKMVSAQTAKELAIGIAGAGAGAGYILYRVKAALAAAGATAPWQELLPASPVAGLGALLTAQGQPLGALNVAGYGMAPGYSVGPQGSFGPGGYGAVTLGAGVM